MDEQGPTRTRYFGAKYGALMAIVCLVIAVYITAKGQPLGLAFLGGTAFFGAFAVWRYRRGEN